MLERRKKISNILSEQGVDALFVSCISNVHYLSGYTGDEAWLLQKADGEAVLITDFRYIEQAERECGDLPIRLHRRNGSTLEDIIDEYCRVWKVAKLGFESSFISFAEYHRLDKALDSVELVPTDGLTESLRRVKDVSEIVLLRQACRATDAVFAAVCEVIHPGMSEREAELELYRLIAEQGCTLSFPSIVASGINGSLPHAVPSAEKILQEGELVTMDFGCRYRGYCADITRTVCLGKADSRQKEIYDIVLAAQLRGLSAVEAGVAAKDADFAARSYIADQGYGDNFGHGLGHGVGLDIHEAPSLSPASADILVQGNFVTIEPGIYIPRFGGVRIEDTVMVTEQGCEIMFNSTKGLLEL